MLNLSALIVVLNIDHFIEDGIDFKKYFFNTNTYLASIIFLILSGYLLSYFINAKYIAEGKKKFIDIIGLVLFCLTIIVTLATILYFINIKWILISVI